MRNNRNLCIVIIVFILNIILSGNKTYSSNNQPASITVDATEIVGPLPHIWNGLMGNSNLTLTPQGERLK